MWSEKVLNYLKIDCVRTKGRRGSELLFFNLTTLPLVLHSLHVWMKDIRREMRSVTFGRLCELGDHLVLYCANLIKFLALCMHENEFYKFSVNREEPW